MRAELGLDERVDLPGFVNVATELDKARCFALSSLQESFGLACVEALAHGLPCVVTACGGPTEIIDTPALGVVIPVDDAAALALAIDAALAAPGDPAPRQARARDFALDAALDRARHVASALSGLTSAGRASSARCSARRTAKAMIDSVGLAWLDVGNIAELATKRFGASKQRRLWSTTPSLRVAPMRAVPI